MMLTLFLHNVICALGRYSANECHLHCVWPVRPCVLIKGSRGAAGLGWAEMSVICAVGRYNANECIGVYKGVYIGIAMYK